jgi:formamidopyrimidine-DNA glycosylase
VPELPEVETVCRTLDPIVTGRRFATFELLWPRTLSHPDPGEFLQRIAGQTITSVRRRAKLIVVTLATGGVITVHLRMTGELLFRNAGFDTGENEKTPYLRAAFLFEEGSELLFYDIRKFGRIAYLTTTQYSELEDNLGIEPLNHSFTPEWLAHNLSRRKRQLKPLLLDQTFIAGLGNIYVDESLFLAGLHPLTRSDAVTSDQAEKLHAAIVDTLSGAVERRGTTLRDYRSGLGESGENRSRLVIYGSKPGAPCSRCGTALERLIVGQRGSILCPNCQPLPILAGRPNR